MSDFFKPVRFGDLKLANRIVMAPMTRARADLDGTPNASAAEYYRQRASAGLIISEAANVGPMSAAFERAPGLWTEEQTAGWRPIVAGVKAQGGCMVAQLWHSGRAAARGLLGDREPLSPSGINHDLDSLQVWALLQNGAYVRIAATQSRAMTQAEIKCVVEEYRVAVNRHAKGTPYRRPKGTPVRRLVPVVHSGGCLWTHRCKLGGESGQSLPKPRGGMIASSSVRSRSQIARNASAVALS
jgi:2,4-dienoyl-CoA reductase-like NADH-dependent reductase (Old Yellow Enzyme family)